MAKRRAPPGGGRIPSFYASPNYKRWLRKTLDEKGWTFDDLADEIKRRGTRVTTSAISQLLGRKDTEPVGSNTELMPAINEALGRPPPRFCEPDSEIEQLQDAIVARWSRMTPHERQALIALARID